MDADTEPTAVPLSVAWASTERPRGPTMAADAPAVRVLRIARRFADAGRFGDARRLLTRPPFRSTLLAVSAGLDLPVGTDGSDVHLDLAVALRQVGLPGQALREVAIACPRPALVGLRLWITGVCCHDLGAYPEAIAAFKRALHTRTLGPSATLYVYYALGSTHDALGDLREAAYYYERVRARRPRFLDVEARLRGTRRRVDRRRVVAFGDDHRLTRFFVRMGLDARWLPRGGGGR